MSVQLPNLYVAQVVDDGGENEEEVKGRLEDSSGTKTAATQDSKTAATDTATHMPNSMATNMSTKIASVINQGFSTLGGKLGRFP